jgi:signal transduction histidine kinase
LHCARHDNHYHRGVTLAQRLLLAIAILTIAMTTVLALGVREAWRQSEEERFQSQFDSTVNELQRETGRQHQDLLREIGRLCAHEPIVDQALTGLKSDTLDHERRQSASALIRELKNARPLFDELFLLTSAGEILTAGHADGFEGKRDPALARLVARLARERRGRIRLAEEGAPLALQAACIHGDRRAWVGLLAARHLQPMLEEIATRNRVELTLGNRAPSADRMSRPVQLSELGELSLTASQSRTPLLEKLSDLSTTIFAIGGATVAAAMLVAILLARGLARPIVALSEQARKVVAGDPEPVESRGGRELEQFADAFNRAIADLVALRKRLAATERIAARREIARRVAHEIKNPLAPIRAAVETLRRLRARNDPAFDEYFEEATRTVLEEVARISNIVAEFTRFARLPPPNPKPIDFAEAVRSVVNLHAGAGAEIEFSSDSLPQVSADRDQVVQVVTNLVQNAIEAARTAASPRVWVRLELSGDAVVLRVRDNGAGVPPEMQERLFEPYATTKPAGTGLGLPIVERIVVEHGGEVRHVAPPGGGAEFTATFPISGPTLLPEPPASTRSQL